MGHLYLFKDDQRHAASFFPCSGAAFGVDERWSCFEDSSLGSISQSMRRKVEWTLQLESLNALCDFVESNRGSMNESIPRSSAKRAQLDKFSLFLYSTV